MDDDSSANDKNKSLDDNDKSSTEEPKSFPLLNALSDLLMLPKDMLMDRTIRMEVHIDIHHNCLSFSFSVFSFVYSMFIQFPFTGVPSNQSSFA